MGETLVSPSAKAAVKYLTDAVYLDTDVGVAGTAWPIGTPQVPVDNVADAILIAAARNLRRIHIYGYGAFLPAAATEITFFGSGWENTLNLDGQDVDYSQLENLQLTGNYGGTTHPRTTKCFVNTDNLRGELDECYLIGTYNPYGHVYLINCVYKDVNIIFDTLTAGREVELFGAKGNVQFSNLNVFADNTVNVYGNELDLTINGTCTLGTINLYGKGIRCFNNSGGATVNDYTNEPRAEVPVNITAILASETNFLNLATVGFKYTIDDLVLKCADPGANTVNVKLYKLVNGASVLVETFPITTANYTVYFNMMDMFGQPMLAGDNLKITVQATAGGPYAVTGSYAVRSA